MGKQHVAHQHGRRRAIDALSRAASATKIRPIHDVVMHERGQMHHLDNGRGADESGGNGFGLAPAAEKNERRSKAFAAGIEAISGKFTNFRLEGRKLRAEHAVELGQVRLKHRKQVGKSGGGWWRADGWHEREA